MKCQAEILQHEVVIILKVNMTKFNIEILEGLFVSMWKLCLIHRSSQLIKLIQRILCAKVILPRKHDRCERSKYSSGEHSKENNLCLESNIGILTTEAILIDVLFVLLDRVNQSFVILYSYTEDFYDLHSSDIFYCCRTHLLKRR